MKLATIGFGQAGGKIVDALVDHDGRTGGDVVSAAVAINSARADLRGLQRIPRERRVLIGEDRVKGNGVGADNELGAAVAEESIDEIQAAIDTIPVHEIDAFLIVAGLGGGTGSGGAPILAKHLGWLYTEPVYGLGVLPAGAEGSIYSLNAARSFRTFVDEVDNLLLFDNDAWRSAGESLEGGYAAMNDELVRRFRVIFGAGNVSPGDCVGRSVVDASEVINTLSGTGVATVGYAAADVDPGGDGFLRHIGDAKARPAGTRGTNRIASLVREATLGGLTLPASAGSAERALLVASGPPDALDRKGIERGRKWLEEETGSMEVRGGDFPIPGAERVAVAVVLAGVSDVPRIESLQRLAVDARKSAEDRRRGPDRDLPGIVAEEVGELRPLF